MNAEKPLLELKSISLSYGNVTALKDISLSLQASSVHAIVGEHGAGKSTLCQVLSGFLKPTAGHLKWLDSPLRSFSAESAQKLGIALVTQQNHMFDDLSVAVNFFLNKDRKNGLSLITDHRIVRDAQEYLDRHDFAIDAAKLLRDLPLPDRVLIDILRHVAGEPRLLVLDEALEKLTAGHLDKVIEILQARKRAGAGIVFVTHNIDDLYQLADRVTILRRGSVVITDSVQNIEKINLLRLAYTQSEREPAVGDTSEEFYQLLKYNAAILELLPVTLLVTDQRNRIKLMNRAAKEYFASARRFRVNQHLRSMFQPHNSSIYNLIRESLNGVEVVAFSSLAFQTSKAERTVNIRICPILDGASKIGTMVIIDDITEQEKLKGQMQFSEKLASVGLLAAGVAHEINNPLEIIYNYTDQLKTRMQSSDERRIIADLDAEIDSIKQIISHLITFSKDDSAGVQVFNLNELLENLLRLVTINAKNAGVSISCRGMKAPLLVKANRNEIKQVFLNLFRNSFEAMPHGGELEIETRRPQKERDAFAQVLFRDTGAGIDKKSLENIFLPFFTTKQGRSEHMGLGLSVSYGIVRKYGGSIKVRNRSPKGCEFEILLPRLGTALPNGGTPSN
jgi:PAS domain S-box-containing protein